jgi:hypothetical protein
MKNIIKNLFENIVRFFVLIGLPVILWILASYLCNFIK